MAGEKIAIRRRAIICKEKREEKSRNLKELNRKLEGRNGTKKGNSRDEETVGNRESEEVRKGND